MDEAINEAIMDNQVDSAIRQPRVRTLGWKSFFEKLV